jgi:hypothetical protein
MSGGLKTESQTLLRRMAAKLLGDYPPPALSHTQELLQELEAAAQGVSDDSEWAGFAGEIRAALRSQGAERFLRLAPIARTVHPRIRSHGRGYLEYVRGSRHFSPSLQRAMTESPVGQPLVHPYYPLSSPLLVQHAYHFTRLIEATGLDLARLGLVADFGAGYGSFFRLLRNLGYRGRYVICDLPVMCALQRFYLRNLFGGDSAGQAPANLEWESADIPATLRRESAAHGPSLFIATWSLSETPLSVRDLVAPALAGFDYVLCAYQRSFGSRDNRAWFTALERSLPQFRWQHAECGVYRNNFYLVGHKAAA